VNLGGIEVFYTDDLDGGGSRYGQDYLDFIGKHLGPRSRAFEWCAGPAFIGFSLLAHNLCESLCLADVNPAAIDACAETVRRNHLEDVVALYLSDGLDDIPDSQVWDLVVGNPPHAGTADVRPHINRPTIVYQDVDWKLHRCFYESVGKHLTADSQVVIQENSLFSGPETFRGMIEDNGLRFVGAPRCETPEASRYYFYVWSVPGAVI
jgi:hypothetical protein